MPPKPKGSKGKKVESTPATVTESQVTTPPVADANLVALTGGNVQLPEMKLPELNADPATVGTSNTYTLPEVTTPTPGTQPTVAQLGAQLQQITGQSGQPSGLADQLLPILSEKMTQMMDKQIHAIEAIRSGVTTDLNSSLTQMAQSILEQGKMISHLYQQVMQVLTPAILSMQTTISNWGDDGEEEDEPEEVITVAPTQQPTQADPTPRVQSGVPISEGLRMVFQQYAPLLKGQPVPAVPFVTQVLAKHASVLNPATDTVDNAMEHFRSSGMLAADGTVIFPA